MHDAKHFIACLLFAVAAVTFALKLYHVGGAAVSAGLFVEAF